MERSGSAIAARVLLIGSSVARGMCGCPAGSDSGDRQDRSVVGDRESGAYLAKFAWTKIVRHQLVGGASSPDEPALSDYWAARRRQGTPLLMDRTSLRLMLVQAVAAPSVRDFCCTQTARRKAHASGNSG